MPVIGDVISRILDRLGRDALVVACALILWTSFAFWLFAQNGFRDALANPSAYLIAALGAASIVAFSVWWTRFRPPLSRILIADLFPSGDPRATERGEEFSGAVAEYVGRYVQDRIYGEVAAKPRVIRMNGTAFSPDSLDRSEAIRVARRHRSTVLVVGSCHVANRTAFRPRIYSERMAGIEGWAIEGPSLERDPSDHDRVAQATAALALTALAVQLHESGQTAVSDAILQSQSDDGFSPARLVAVGYRPDDEAADAVGQLSEPVVPGEDSGELPPDQMCLDLFLWKSVLLLYFYRQVQLGERDDEETSPPLDDRTVQLGLNLTPLVLRAEDLFSRWPASNRILWALYLTPIAHLESLLRLSKEVDTIFLKAAQNFATLDEELGRLQINRGNET